MKPLSSSVKRTSPLSPGLRDLCLLRLGIEADVLAPSAEVYTWMGQPEGAIQRGKQAMRLNPYYPNWYLWILGFILSSVKLRDLVKVLGNRENTYVLLTLGETTGRVVG